MAENPPRANACPPEQVTGHSGNEPGQGPFMRVTLRLSGGVISGASFETYQCPGAHDCGKAVCELASGRSLEEARTIRHEHLAERVGPLPSHRRHCYGLALLALSDAINRFRPD